MEVQKKPLKLYPVQIIRENAIETVYIQDAGLKYTLHDHATLCYTIIGIIAVSLSTYVTLRHLKELKK